jgi:hypothetical protein
MFCGILSAAGILVLVITLLHLKGLLAFVKFAERATGKVTELVEQEEEGGIYYLPVFEFTTHNKELVRYRHNVSSAPSDWVMGEEAVFIFDPRDPESAKFCTYKSIFGWTVIFLALALTAIVIGGGYFLLQCYLK